MLLLFLLFFSINAFCMDIPANETVIDGWQAPLDKWNGEIFTGTVDVECESIEEFKLTQVKESNVSPSIIFVLPDLPACYQNTNFKKQLLKDSRLFAEQYANHNQKNIIIALLKVQNSIEPANLKAQGLRISNMIDLLKEHNSIIIGIGVGGCIAKAAVHHLKDESSAKVPLLILIATPIIESRYGDHFSVGTCRKILNFYSTSDDTQLSDVILSTYRKIEAVQDTDGKLQTVYNIRTQINGKEPSKDGLYAIIKKMFLILTHLEPHKIYTGLDLNLTDQSFEPNNIQLVIRTVKDFKDMIDPLLDCVEIKLSNEHNTVFTQLYGKDISDKRSAITNATSNILTAAWGYATRLASSKK